MEEQKYTSRNVTPLQESAFNEEVILIKADPRFIGMVDALAEGMVHASRLSDARTSIPKLDKYATLNRNSMLSERSKGRLISFTVAAEDIKDSFRTRFGRFSLILFVIAIAFFVLRAGAQPIEQARSAPPTVAVTQEAPIAPTMPVDDPKAPRP